MSMGDEECHPQVILSDETEDRYRRQTGRSMAQGTFLWLTHDLQVQNFRISWPGLVAITNKVGQSFGQYHKIAKVASENHANTTRNFSFT